MSDLVRELYNVIECGIVLKSTDDGVPFHKSFKMCDGSVIKPIRLEYIKLSNFSAPMNVRGHHLLYCNVSVFGNMYFDMDMNDVRVFGGMSVEDRECFAKYFFGID